jgi:hypothetical protein
MGGGDGLHRAEGNRFRGPPAAVITKLFGNCVARLAAFIVPPRI